MSVRIKLYSATVFLCLLIMPMAGWCESWLYYDINNPKNQFLISEKPPFGAWLDMAGEVKFCGHEESFKCFDAEGFRFAVPRNFKGKQKKWSHGGADYVFEGVSKISILGQVVSVFNIDSTIDSVEIRYFYTQNRGLIGFSRRGSGCSVVLILSQKCGFGSPVVCYRR